MEVRDSWSAWKGSQTPLEFRLFRWQVALIPACTLNLARIFHTHEIIFQRNIRRPCAQSDLAAVSPDEVGPTGRRFLGISGSRVGADRWAVQCGQRRRPPDEPQSKTADARGLLRPDEIPAPHRVGLWNSRRFSRSRILNPGDLRRPWLNPTAEFKRKCRSRPELPAHLPCEQIKSRVRTRR